MKHEEYTFRGFTVPGYMLEGIDRYIEKGIPPGGFLHAVLSNDLKGAVDHADTHNMQNIPAYVGYFVNEIPAICWGTSQRVNAWINMSSEERLSHRGLTPL